MPVAGLGIIFLSASQISTPQPKEALSGVTRAVLKNGLRVVDHQESAGSAGNRGRELSDRR